MSRRIESDGAEKSAIVSTLLPFGLNAVVKAIGGLTPKDMAIDIGVPFHKGAAKYYKEVGAM